MATFAIESRTFINNCSRYFADTLTEADYTIYPELQSNQLCKISRSDSKRKYPGEKTAAGKTGANQSDILLGFERVLVQLSGAKKHNIPVICFFIYVLQNIKLTNGSSQSIYKWIIPEGAVNENIIRNKYTELMNIPRAREFMTEIANAIVNEDVGELMRVFNTYATMPDNNAKKTVERIKEQFLEGNLDFPMKHFFKIWDEIDRIYVSSIYQDDECRKEYRKKDRTKDDIKYKIGEKNGDEITYKYLNEIVGWTSLKMFDKYNGNATFIQVLSDYNEKKTKVNDIIKKILKKEKLDFQLVDFFTEGKTESDIPFLSPFQFIVQNENAGNINALYTILKDKGLVQEQTNVEIQKQEIKRIFEQVDPTKCTLGQTNAMLFDFKDYTFEEFDKFFNYSQYCFSYYDLALSVISNKGAIKIENTTLSPERISKLPKEIARYVFHSKDEDLKNAIKSSFESSYSGEVRSDIFKFTTAESFENIVSIKNNLVRFYEYLINVLPNKQKIDNYKAVFNKTCNSFFELIGLLGYVCLSDDISIFENDGSYFFTSEYCKEMFKYIYTDKLRFLHNDFKAIGFGGKEIVSLMTELDGGTCIHGIGNSFIRYYLNTYEAGLLAKQSILKDASVALPSNADEELKAAIFKIAPYVVVTPDELFKQTGIRYLTCVKFDKPVHEQLQAHPLHSSYLVFGAKLSPTSSSDTVKCMYIYAKKHIPYDKYDSVDGYFHVYKDSYGANDTNFVLKDCNSARDIYSSYYANHKQELYDLLKIPFTFHKERRQTFTVFADYTYNLCRMLSTPESATTTNTISKIKQLSQKPLFDIIMFEEIAQLPRYMTFIKTEGVTPYKNMHMWNTNFEVNVNVEDLLTGNYIEEKGKPYYIDSLQNFLTLPYTVDDNGNAVIKTPVTRKDVTKQYQVAKLLGKMLCNDTLSKIPFITDDTDRILEQYYYFESYYKMVCGQDSNLRNLFSKEQKTIKDDGISIVKNYRNYLKKDEEVIIIKHLKVVLLLFYIKFYKSLIMVPYFKHLEKSYKTSKNSILLALQAKTLEAIMPVYKTILHDIVYVVCSEGMEDVGIQYHFTELAKDYYLLVDLGKKLGNVMPTVPSNHQSKNLILQHTLYSDEDKKRKDMAITELKKNNAQQIDSAIDTLNENLAYFNNVDLELSKMEQLNSHSESVPRAIEYRIKTLLIKEHQARIYSALLPFEKMIEFACNAKSYNEYANNNGKDSPKTIAYADLLKLFSLSVKEPISETIKTISLINIIHDFDQYLSYFIRRFGMDNISMVVETFNDIEMALVF